MPRYNFVLLDADNTLWDFDRAEHNALRLTLESHGIPFTPGHEALYVTHNKALWEAFDRGEISQADLVVERFAAFLRTMNLQGNPAELNRCYLDRLSEQGDMLPGAESFCRRLAPVCTLSIVTNGVTTAQKGRFSRCPIRDCISHLYISQEVGWQKPRREFFDAVLRDLAVTDKSRCVMVGDTEGSDILGAKNAGLDAVWYNPKGLTGRADLSPALIASNFDQIATFILGETV